MQVCRNRYAEIKGEMKMIRKKDLLKKILN